MKSYLKILLVLAVLALIFSITAWHGQAAPAPAAQVIVTGTVRDATPFGHTYPLYARVNFSIAGDIQATVYTNPFTGQFSLSLFQNQSYTVVTSAMIPGYATITSGVTPASNPTVLNLQLPTTGDCTATGYSDNVLLFETFDGVNAPNLPAGWTDMPVNASLSHWTTASNVYEAVPALSSPNTVMFNAAGGNSLTRLLNTTNLNLQTRSTSSVSFWLYQTSLNPDSHDTVQLIVSTNNGVDWAPLPGDQPIERYSDLTGWEFYRFDISDLAGSGKPAVRIGLQAFSGNGALNNILIDNIRLGNGACEVVPGGLMSGYIKDSHGGGVSQARVYRAAAPSTDYTYSFTTPADTNIGDGLYLLFSGASGNNDLTVIQSRFNPKTLGISVTPETISRLDFTLESAIFNFIPMSLTGEVVGNASATQHLQINNFGQNSGTVWLSDTPTNWLTVSAEMVAIAPYSTLSVNDPNAELPTHSSSGEAASFASLVQNYLWPAPTGPLALPQFPTAYAASIPGKARLRSAIASCDGKSFYLFGGQDPSSAFLNESWKFDTTSGIWTRKANMPVALMNMNAACLDTTIYLVGGYNSVYTNNLLIYNTITDTWIQSTWPHVHTPMLAVYKGTLYAFGGAPINKETYAYTLSTGWIQKADLPTAISFGTAVTVDDYIFVVGGVNGGGTPLTSVQRYNPATDTWETNGPNLPEGRSNNSAVWYGDHTIFLLGSGGRAGDSWSAWNDGLVYDTSLWPNGTWSRLPGGIISTPVHSAAGICLGERFWLVGGVDANAGDGNSIKVYNTHQFLDYGLPCHASLPAIPWLNLSANTLSLGPTSSGQITLTFSGAGVSQPGFYRGLLRINSDSPFSYPDIPIQMIRVDSGAGVSIAPQSGMQIGHPGKTVTYNFTVTNTSAVPTDFPIAITNTQIPTGWSVNISPTSTGILNQAESKQISVQVTLPGSGVVDGTLFPLNLSIGPSLDPVHYGTATFVTTFYSRYSFLLPVVIR